MQKLEPALQKRARAIDLATWTLLDLVLVVLNGLFAARACPDATAFFLLLAALAAFSLLWITET